MFWKRASQESTVTHERYVSGTYPFKPTATVDESQRVRCVEVISGSLKMLAHPSFFPLDVRLKAREK